MGEAGGVEGSVGGRGKIGGERLREERTYWGRKKDKLQADRSAHGQTGGELD